MLAALAEGTSEIRHFSSAADCISTLQCLRALGADVQCEGDTERVTGRGIKGLRRPRRDLDAGNSRTTMRLLAGHIPRQSFPSTLTREGFFRLRPMRREHDSVR